MVVEQAQEAIFKDVLDGIVHARVDALDACGSGLPAGLDARRSGRRKVDRVNMVHYYIVAQTVWEQFRDDEFEFDSEYTFSREI